MADKDKKQTEEILDQNAGEVTLSEASKIATGEVSQEELNEREEAAVAKQPSMVAASVLQGNSDGVMYATKLNDPNEVNDQPRFPVRVKEPVTRKIGVRWYNLLPGKTYNVPENVKRVLLKADLLTVI